MMIELGSKVRDTITGFAGIATGRTDWLYGCTRIAIEPQELHDGQPIAMQWFDDQRVEVLAKDEPRVSADSRSTTGGPQRDPTY